MAPRSPLIRRIHLRLPSLALIEKLGAAVAFASSGKGVAVEGAENVAEEDFVASGFQPEAGSGSSYPGFKPGRYGGFAQLCKFALIRKRAYERCLTCLREPTPRRATPQPTPEPIPEAALATSIPWIDLLKKTSLSLPPPC